MEIFGEILPTATALFLILALIMALGFEFVNGFHDTANAVATVIYTHSRVSSMTRTEGGAARLSL